VEIFRELTVKGNPEDLSRFKTLLTPTEKSGWRRDTSAEAELRNLDPSEDPGLCFLAAARPGRPAARLWLAHSRQNEIYVPNVVPESTSPLCRATYNEIVREFLQLVARPAAKAARVVARLGKDAVELEDMVPAYAAECLRQFCALANKSTGSSHPLDRARWFRFIIVSHAQRSKLQADELERWLSLEGGWTPARANELALEYEFGRELLSQYRKHA
jgi:hypothetical protein